MSPIGSFSAHRTVPNGGNCPIHPPAEQRQNALASSFFYKAFLVVGIGLVSTNSEILAQVQGGNRTGYSRDQNREFIDDYNNTMQDDYGDNNRRVPPPPNPGVPNGGSLDIKQIRPLIHDFADLASQLTYSMNDQMARVPSLRSLYSDAHTISAEAAGLDRRLANVADHRTLVEAFGQLDADWREMAYRLQGVRGLTAETKDLIANLNDLDQQIRKSLNTQPQVNRNDVALLVAGMATDLQNLIEDIKLELRSAQTAQPLLIQAGRTRQQALSIAAMCRDSQLDAATLVREYKQFEANWMQLATKLQVEDNRYLRRSLQRISQSNSKVHQVLLLPHVTDKSQLLFLTSTLKKEIDEFFSRTPLLLVIRLPKAKQSLATAEQFHAACDQFVEQVNQGADQNALIDSFRFIEEANRGFADVFGQIDSDGAMAVLQRIEQTLSTIRSSLQIEREDFDRGVGHELVASIDNLATSLDIATQRWLTNDPQSFSAACRQETTAMAERAAAIHNDMVRGVPVNQLRRDVDDLYERWRTVYRYIVKCQTDDRRNLARLSGKLTPAMVELRTLVSQPTTEQTVQRPIRR